MFCRAWACSVPGQCWTKEEPVLVCLTFLCRAVPSHAVSHHLPPSCPTPGCSPHQGDQQQRALSQEDVSAWDFESEETTPPGCSEEKGGRRAPATGRCPHPSQSFSRGQVCLEQQDTSATCCAPTHWPKTCEAVLLSLFLLLVCKCPEFISSVLMEISFFLPLKIFANATSHCVPRTFLANKGSPLPRFLAVIEAWRGRIPPLPRAVCRDVLL